jgi:hypothetical protein
MTYLEPEDILRRVLHAAAESVQPAPDGLAKIHARLSAPRPLMVARLIAGWQTLSGFVLLRLEPMMFRLEPVRAALVSWLDTALPTADRQLRLATERLRPMLDRSIAAVAWLGRLVQPRTGPEGRRSRYALVRSVAAMAAVVLVAVASGVALSVLPHQIVQEAQSVFSTQPNGSGGGTHPTGVNGNGTHYQPTSGPSGRNGAAPTPSRSCQPTSKPKSHPTSTSTPSTETSTQPVIGPSSSAPSSSAPSSSAPSSSPPSSSPPTSPPPTSGPDQGNSSSSAAKSAQDSAVVITGARSGSAATASPTPSSTTCSSGGS